MDKLGKKTGGRIKGTPNKATKISKDIINDFLTDYYNSGEMRKDFENIADPKQRLDVATKLMQFVVPQMKSTDLDLKVDNAQLSITDKLKQLASPVTKED